MNSIHACSDQKALNSKCCAEEEIDPACGHPQHDHDEKHDDDHPSKPNAEMFGVDLAHSDHDHCHHGCMDDSCNVNVVGRVDFVPVDFSVAYFAGIECLNETDTANFSRSSFPPDLRVCAQKMRPHLLLGVQLL